MPFSHAEDLTSEEAKRFPPFLPRDILSSKWRRIHINEEVTSRKKANDFSGYFNRLSGISLAGFDRIYARLRQSLCHMAVDRGYLMPDDLILRSNE